MPLTAVHAALGAAAGPLTYDLVSAAVEAGVVEGHRLDWKSALPPQKGLSETDFPKDVAAFANADGGVLIFGVEESDGAATAITGVGAFDENFERSMRDCALRAIQPPLYNVRVDHLRRGGNDLVVVTVPQSPEAPHLVRTRSEPGFRVPRRDGRDTIWMSETEIAHAYSRRFAEHASAIRLLDEAYDRASDVSLDSELAWFVAAATPVQAPWHQPRRPQDAARRILDAARLGVRTESPLYLGALPEVDPNVRPTFRGWRTALSKGAARRQVSATVSDNGGVALAAAAGGHRAGPATSHAPNEMESRLLESFVLDVFSLMEQVGKVDEVSAYDLKIGVEAASDEPVKFFSRDGSGEMFDTGVLIHTVRPVRATISLLEPLVPQIRDAALDLLNQGGVTYLYVVED